MFHKIAIANRGAVAARLVRTLRLLNIKSLVLYSEADRDLPYLVEADEKCLIGPPPALQSYLNQETILEAARTYGADAVHPGYGFLSENFGFAEKVLASGMAFVGPSPKWLKLLGDKTAARELMAAEGLPVSPSTGLLKGSACERATQAASLGFPLLIKPAAGGGGIGMIPVFEKAGLVGAIESAEKLAVRSFGDSGLYAERLWLNPRHIEFQVLADCKGRAVHLFERDCSTQRRRQKVVEEAGAPDLPAADLEIMAERAARVLSRLGYDHLATLETLYTPETGFVFLEVNPRLQVEHGVTEEVTGLDLAAAQIRLATGLDLDEAAPGRPKALAGHAVEARIYAEDPVKFFPSPGPLKVFRPPSGPGVRVETGFAEGSVVTHFYDPLIALVIVRAETRLKALDLMAEALAEFAVEGIKTNIPFIRGLMKYGPFREGRVHIGLAGEYLASLERA
ncbi:MAG: biotin carboxylase [Candidatus Adiutrix intracellularis]|jgi:acetyl-CoA carboxylase biotin carboxylase subunit|nr:MAG: biotin carboxylase [Candidatus Adiutrix intracellularis]MDR2827332.1 biotin carboxylase [Candidatus Adiutrix intracellularis]